VAAPARAGLRASVAMRGPDVPRDAAAVPRRSAVFGALAALPAVVLAGRPGAVFADDSKANRLLVSLGFAPLPNTKGYTQLAEFVGKAGAANIDGQKTRGFKLDSPLLVAFNYPGTWVTALPTVSTNGESGTVSAGNYIKGDSATFVAVPVSSKDAASVPKAVLAESVVTSATGDVYQDVKVSKVVPGENGYVTWEYTYTLLTRAGFEVDRKGVAAGTIVNGQLCALITATVSQRWKSEGDKLRELCSSFRVYPVKKSAVQQFADMSDD